MSFLRIKAEMWTLKQLPVFFRKAIGASHGLYDIDRVENITKYYRMIKKIT
jgi:hypothetical protein